MMINAKILITLLIISFGLTSEISFAQDIPVDISQEQPELLSGNKNAPEQRDNNDLSKTKTEKEQLDETDFYSYIPDAYLLEMDEVYNQCISNEKSSSYIDCRCFATEFLYKRIEVGEQETQNAIKLSLLGTCVNVPGIAGMAYEECMDSILIRKIRNPEPGCTCFANSFAKAYKKTPVQSSRRLIDMKLKIYEECGIISAAARARNP